MEKKEWPYIKARRHFELYRGELMSDTQKYLLDDLEDRERRIKTSGPKPTQQENIKTRLNGVIEKIDDGSTDKEKVRIAKDAIIELVQAYELNDQQKNEGNPEFLVQK